MNETLAMFLQQLKADRKKAIVLGVLFVGMIVVYVRMFTKSPASAESAPVAAVVAVNTLPQPVAQPSAVARVTQAFAAPAEAGRVDITHMLRAFQRDLFDTDLSNYSQAPEAEAVGSSRGVASSQPVQLNKWLKGLFGVVNSQARRFESSRVELETDLAKLTLQGTILGPEPKAYINGRLVRVGDKVGNFRVIGIYARQVSLQKSGCNVHLSMP